MSSSSTTRADGSKPGWPVPEAVITGVHAPDDVSWIHSAFYRMGTGDFLGVERPLYKADHWLLFGAEVKDE